ncbi:TPA: N-acetylmuramic acid 6-phosphate etherase [Streptococcus suis]|uniref:N-acetylmuramic acid 6-phosphate etherase n=2 Tax=Streptococcus suis TaxID=1307 RepID=UPI000CF3E80D|nr:N-acetylmuramic acid 6-phosphate etherase [Streptococcus suis]MBO4111567.1 N-acetylmuramic acid 6-phosphate etherase [Streptococcus suis]MCB2860710.1 N-acetylmuramic acid 6-phosphate etherase [Streptococcus suis]MCB2869248.1 N-acetylmuramic acid 6-phosphate etherase [Streptococcus suis]MCL4880886.1 N-acetylmuramic acid 6-phosphate etherase [Streptococcus suis]HEM3474169.1 N-acetylmuramic acid 6-phosphate etherase [Streptococcus suis]
MDIERLNTEQSNPDSFAIETMSIGEITAYINREDGLVALAIQRVLPQINAVIETVIDCLKKDGRLIYVGAGTSGRLGVLDASECPPTFGVSPDLVQGLIAGGNGAVRAAKEGAEDNRQAAVEDLQKIGISAKDVVIGLAASGRTPYVLEAVSYAHEIGARTASISCVQNAEISPLVDAPIEVLVGPEVVTGSSRMKAGTAQKMILNMISTTSMIQLGKVFRGFMVDVQPTNQKLIQRAKRIICETTGCTEIEAEHIFQQANQDVKLAILMQLSQLNQIEAKKLLENYHNHISFAIQSILDKEN